MAFVLFIQHIKQFKRRAMIDKPKAMFQIKFVSILSILKISHVLGSFEAVSSQDRLFVLTQLLRNTQTCHFHLVYDESSSLEDCPEQEVGPVSIRRIEKYLFERKYSPYETFPFNNYVYSSRNGCVYYILYAGEKDVMISKLMDLGQVRYLVGNQFRPIRPQLNYFLIFTTYPLDEKYTNALLTMQPRLRISLRSHNRSFYFCYYCREKSLVSMPLVVQIDLKKFEQFMRAYTPKMVNGYFNEEYSYNIFETLRKKNNLTLSRYREMDFPLILTDENMIMMSMMSFKITSPVVLIEKEELAFLTCHKKLTHRHMKQLYKGPFSKTVVIYFGIAVLVLMVLTELTMFVGIEKKRYFFREALSSSFAIFGIVTEQLQSIPKKLLRRHLMRLVLGLWIISFLVVSSIYKSYIVRSNPKYWGPRHQRIYGFGQLLHEKGEEFDYWADVPDYYSMGGRYGDFGYGILAKKEAGQLPAPGFKLYSRHPSQLVYQLLEYKNLYYKQNYLIGIIAHLQIPEHTSQGTDQTLIEKEITTCNRTAYIDKLSWLQEESEYLSKSRWYRNQSLGLYIGYDYESFMETTHAWAMVDSEDPTLIYDLRRILEGGILQVLKAATFRNIYTSRKDRTMDLLGILRICAKSPHLEECPTIEGKPPSSKLGDILYLITIELMAASCCALVALVEITIKRCMLGYKYKIKGKLSSL